MMARCNHHAGTGAAVDRHGDGGDTAGVNIRNQGLALLLQGAARAERAGPGTWRSRARQSQTAKTHAGKRRACRRLLPVPWPLDIRCTEDPPAPGLSPHLSRRPSVPAPTAPRASAPDTRQWRSWPGSGRGRGENGHVCPWRPSFRRGAVEGLCASTGGAGRVLRQVAPVRSAAIVCARDSRSVYAKPAASRHPFKSLYDQAISMQLRADNRAGVYLRAKSRANLPRFLREQSRPGQSTQVNARYKRCLRGVYQLSGGARR